MNENDFTEDELKELKRLASYRSKGKKISKNPAYWVLLVGSPLVGTLAMFFMMSRGHTVFGIGSFVGIFGLGMVLIYQMEKM